MATLLSKRINTAEAAALNYDLGEFASVESNYSPNVQDKGSNIAVFVRPPANVVTGVDRVPDNYVRNQEKVVNIRLENMFSYDELGSVERTADVIDEDAQILAPLRTGLQLALKDRFWNGLSATANTVIQATGNNSGQQNTVKCDWGDIFKAVARVQESLVGTGDDINVLIPSTATAIVAGASLGQYVSPNEQSKIFKNVLGEAFGANIIQTRVPGFRTTVSSMPTLSNTNIQDGDSWLNVTSTTAFIPAGTVYTVAGITACDLRGNDVIDPVTNAPALALFGTPIDIPVGSTRIPLGKQIFSNAAAGFANWGDTFYSNNAISNIKNWGTATAGADGNPKFPTTNNGGVGGGVSFVRITGTPGALTQVNGGKNMILVYSKKAFAAATAVPGIMGTYEEYVDKHFSVPIRSSIGATPRGGVKELRMETIVGFSGVYAPGAVAIVF